MKKKILVIFLFLLLITGCKNNDIPDIVLKTNGYLEWDNEIDYSNPDNWLSLDSYNKKSVDLLYLYPDSFYTMDDVYVSSIEDNYMRDNAIQYFNTEIGVFKEECNIYAPYYRQVDYDYLMGLSNEDYDELLEYASYKDIENFLDYYFENFNNNKPFIIAGDGQGSKLLSYSLENYFLNHQDYYDKLLVAYLIGTSISYDYINSELMLAEFNNDLGVIVSFNVDDNINKLMENNSISINPINWKTDDTYASKDFNLGSMVNNKIIVNSADAKINLETGLIETKYDLSNLTFVNRYRNYEYLLYYNNLKRNVKDRINSYYSD